MIIETKYDIGDWLYSITRAHRTEWVPCAFCDATGFISGANNKTCICPECYGRRGDDRYLPEAWQVANYFPVNRIDVIRCSDELAKEWEPGRFRRITYMEGASGTMWGEEQVFPDREAAQAECDRLNASDAPCEETVTA